jgi:hypothetical protein
MKLFLLQIILILTTITCNSQYINQYNNSASLARREAQRDYDRQADLNRQPNSPGGNYSTALSPEELQAITDIFKKKVYKEVVFTLSATEKATFANAAMQSQKMQNDIKNKLVSYDDLLQDLPFEFENLKSVSKDNASGIQTFQNSNVLISAKFRNGILDGVSTITYKNHPIIDKINATLVNGKLNGRGTVDFKDKSFENLTFVNGKAHGKCQIVENNKVTVSFFRQNNLIYGPVTQYFTGNSYATFIYDNNEPITLLIAKRYDLNFYYPSQELYQGGFYKYLTDGNIVKRFEDGEGTFYAGDNKNDVYDGNGMKGWSNGTLYIGQFKKNTRTGFGKYLYLNGDIYLGNFKDNKSDGFGRYFYIGGERYEGNFKDSDFSGQGKMFYNDESYYEGNWKKSLRDGAGQITKKNGYYLKGTFDKGIQKKATFFNDKNVEITENEYNGIAENGFSKVFYGATSFYEGNFKNGQKSGKGFMKFDDGATYDGEFLNDQMHGTGNYVYLNGTRFVGEMKNSSFNGKGKINYKNGDYYIGEFVNDKFQGKGTYYYANKSSIECDFVAGEATGEGKLVWQNGDYYIGSFLKYNFNGKGKIYYADGLLHHDGQFGNGVKIGQQKFYYRETKETVVGVYQLNNWYGDVTFIKDNGYKKIARWYGEKWNDIKCYDPSGITISEETYNKN